MEEWKSSLIRAQQGDLAAFDAVVRQFQDMAVGYAYSILRDFQLAEDAAQEAFVQAYVDRAMLREPSAFPAWLRKIVFKQCDRVTRRKRVATMSLDDTADLRDAGPTPLAAVARRETQAAVLPAVDALPENQRTAATLFYINGYSLSEVGEFLDVPAKTVKSRLHSARTKLRDRMIGVVRETLRQRAPGDDFHRRVHRILLGLRKVDWSDVARLNQYLNCVISAMEHLGKKYDYGYLACISGYAFRACSPAQGINPGAHHVIEDMPVIEHTFKMLGYSATLHTPSDYETDKKLIMDSIDRGVPVLTFQGVIRFAECCIISGYDNDGDVLLGWSLFMHPHGDDCGTDDSTGYFRKASWHDGDLKQANARILTIGEPTTSLSEEETISETLKWAVRLIRAGYEGHTHYAELVCQATDNWFFLDLMMLGLNANVFQAKLYVAPFLREAKSVLKDKADVLEECARLYDQISDRRREMSRYLPEDQPQTGERIRRKAIRKQYAECVIKIRDLENEAADLFEKMLQEPER